MLMSEKEQNLEEIRDRFSRFVLLCNDSLYRPHILVHMDPRDMDELLFAAHRVESILDNLMGEE